jgi:hypothetical protein
MIVEMILIDADESLLVTLINSNTLEHFQSEFNASLIERSRELSFMFESPKEMFKDLINSFPEIVITKDG